MFSLNRKNVFLPIWKDWIWREKKCANPFISLTSTISLLPKERRGGKKHGFLSTPFPSFLFPSYHNVRQCVPPPILHYYTIMYIAAQRKCHYWQSISQVISLSWGKQMVPLFKFLSKHVFKKLFLNKLK